MVIKNKAWRVAFNSRFIFLLLSCGPDGIRTRDLGLDRAACLAATPRDLAVDILLYYFIIVKWRSIAGDYEILMG
jgi:hypothetical protein